MVAGACLVAAFQSRNSFTSGMKSRFASTRYHMRPRSGVSVATILGGFTVHISNALFQKERSFLSFFHTVICSQEQRNDDRKAAKPSTSFSLFPCHIVPQT